MNREISSLVRDWRPVQFFAMGACFGIWTGWLEGMARVAFQSLNWMSFDARLTVTSTKLIWVAPLVYSVLFGLLAMAVSYIAGSVPWIDSTRVVVTALGTLLFMAPLATGGYTNPVATPVLCIGLAAVLQGWLGRKGMIRTTLYPSRFLWSATIAVVVFAGVEGGARWGRTRLIEELPASAPDSPNIILIVIDTLRADHLSSYGYARDTSPELARIASEGVQFDWAIASSSWTIPSHATMLTGYLPNEHGAGLAPYDNRFPTVAVALAERGYRTGAISANTLAFTRSQGFGAGFIDFDDSFYSLADDVFRTFYGGQVYKFLLRDAVFDGQLPGRRRAEEVTRSAIRWIDQDSSHPFFLMLNYFDVHGPYLPPSPWMNMFASVSGSVNRLNEYVSNYDDFVTRLDPQEVAIEIAAYDGGIAYTDHWIGELIRSLNARGLVDNSAIVVTSDHGESLGQHGLMTHKSSLYIEQIHVPLIVHFPGKVPAGLRIQNPVSHTSLPNTLLEFAGSQRAMAFPAQSLSKLWKEEETQTAWPAPISQLEHQPYGRFTAFPAYTGSLESIVVGRWHMIEQSELGAELFALEGDPREEDDLSTRQSIQTVLQSLSDELHESSDQSTSVGEPR